MKIKTEVEIKDERIASLLCCAFEGGVGYWCRIAEYDRPERHEKYLDQRYTDWPLAEGGAVYVQDHVDSYEEDEDGYFLDDDGERLPFLKLDRAAIDRGMRIMADKYPYHFGRFMGDDEDAETGDVFLQCCLLGEITYG